MGERFKDFDKTSVLPRDDVRGVGMTATAAEWARQVPLTDAENLAALIARIPAGMLPDVLMQLDPTDAAMAIRTLSGQVAANAIASMEPDDATELLGHLPTPEAYELLEFMSVDEAEEIRTLMAFDPDSAGGHMSPEFIAVAPDVHIRQAIAGLRAVAARGGPQTYIYVLEPDERLVGVLPLHKVVFASPDEVVSQIMIADPVRIRSSAPMETASQVIRQHNLLAIPVVDEQDRMLGVVTLDDVVDQIEDALEDDYLLLAGTDAQAMATRRPAQIARLRLPWLLGTMALELGAGLVIANFSGVLQQVILLASFMPVISAVSGNVGLQSAAIVVRGLDTGHVRVKAWRRQVHRELATTLILAIACGVVLGAIGAIWSQHLTFGVVIGIALLISMMTAGLMGTVIPMCSQRLGFDPATTAGPFETAFQDVVGFAVFLWLASLLVGYLT